MVHEVFSSSGSEEGFGAEAPGDGEAGEVGVSGCFYVHFCVSDVDGILGCEGKIAQDCIDHVWSGFSVDIRFVSFDDVKKAFKVHFREFFDRGFVFVGGYGCFDSFFSQFFEANCIIKLNT